MAKDYKDAGKGKKSGGGGKGGGLLLIGLLGGFALGVATTVYLRIGLSTVPGTAEADKAGGATTAKKPEDKPKFDFYKMLPNFEVVVPEQDKQVQRAGDVPAVQAPGTYVLQVGSFRTVEDADRLRAQLALIGIEANIQQVTIDEKDTWHRVRVGPSKNLEEINRIKARLAENKLNALVIRVGD
jgi:cell division protein FtsN